MDNVKFFETSSIRSVWNTTDKRWYFAVADVIGALTDSTNVRDYVKKMRKRDLELNANWGTFCPPLELLAPDGKRRKTQCAHVESLLRIIQSIPSPKAEPFKRWLAQVGAERLEGTEDHTLVEDRTYAAYRAKGYSESWIQMRMRTIIAREELTHEWYKRGVRARNHYATLTAEISRAAFDMTPAQYKHFKRLDKRSDKLRDHMSSLELAFTLLADASTAELTRCRNDDTYDAHRASSIDGGIAGNARRDLEQKSGRPVCSPGNFKQLPKATQCILGRLASH